MKVILIHGFHRSPCDMRTLKNNLQLLGYECYAPKFPLTFNEFDQSVSQLENFFATLPLEKGEKVHLVGHSTGGLLIRKFLEETKFIDRIGRAVLIACPNHGSRFVDIIHQFKFWTKIYKTLHSLRTDYVKQLKLMENYPIEIAAIAGTKNSIILRNIINEENDGRIEVSSVYFSGLTDFATLPYGHKEIHHKIETVQLVDHFLRMGKFEKKDSKQLELQNT